MKALVVLLLCLPLYGQNPDMAKYSPRQILLVDPHPGVEAILPMIVNENGTPTLEYIPVSRTAEYLSKGARPITLADILSTLGASAEKISQLQAENERLWKIAGKDAPQSPTVVVQQPAPSEPSQAELDAQRRQQAIQAWIALQNQNRPTNSNVNVNYYNCSRYPALCVGR